MAKRDEQQRKLDLLEKMSQQRAEITVKKNALHTQIAQTKLELKEKVNVPKRVNQKIKSSFSNNRTKWFVGSTVAGLMLSKIVFGRGRARQYSSYSKIDSTSSKVSRGLLMSSAIFMGKPMLKSFLLGKLKEYIAHKYLLKHQR